MVDVVADNDTDTDGVFTDTEDGMNRNFDTEEVFTDTEGVFTDTEDGTNWDFDTEGVFTDTEGVFTDTEGEISWKKKLHYTLVLGEDKNKSHLHTQKTYLQYVMAKIKWNNHPLLPSL